MKRSHSPCSEREPLSDISPAQPIRLAPLFTKFQARRAKTATDPKRLKTRQVTAQHDADSGYSTIAPTSELVCDDPMSEDELPVVPTGRKSKMPRVRMRKHQQTNVSDFAWRHEYAAAHSFGLGCHHLDTTAWLNAFVSHDIDDKLRCYSTRDDRQFAPPFCVKFSNAAKQGLGRQVVAIGDEDGQVTFVDALQPTNNDAVNGRRTLQAHQNAVFDLAWSKDDSLVATASGDQTCAVIDVQTGTRLNRLEGHLCTLKEVAWDPYQPSMLATASRDGSVRIWDRRTGKGDGVLSSVNLIKNAHEITGKAPKNNGRSATRSVTSLVYLTHQENLLATAGSADGVVRLWDLRKSMSHRVNPPVFEQSVDLSLGGNASPAARSRGISSLALSPVNGGNQLFALNTDSQIYSLDPLNIKRPEPLATYRPTIKESSPCRTSFYVRLAVSPCGKYISSGGNEGKTFIWQTGNPSASPTVLQGHEMEVGAVDWGHEMLASCSDDSSVRFWKFRPDVVEESQSTRWQWSSTWSKE